MLLDGLRETVSYPALTSTGHSKRRRLRSSVANLASLEIKRALLCSCSSSFSLFRSPMRPPPAPILVVPSRQGEREREHEAHVQAEGHAKELLESRTVPRRSGRFFFCKRDEKERSEHELRGEFFSFFFRLCLRRSLFPLSLSVSLFSSEALQSSLLFVLTAHSREHVQPSLTAVKPHLNHSQRERERERQRKLARERSKRSNRRRTIQEWGLWTPRGCVSFVLFAP